MSEHVFPIFIFGPQAQAVGASTLFVAVPNDCISVDELKQAIRVSYPVLEDSIGASRLAINHSYAPGNATITSKDEIALIGLVSGG